LKSIYNFGGSPTLRTQIEQGARADVFVSADMAKMELARKNGTVVERVEETLWLRRLDSSPAASDLKITLPSYVYHRLGLDTQKRLMAELPRQTIHVIPRRDDAAAHAIPQPEVLYTLITTEAEKPWYWDGPGVP
jgi:Bacterial extracellular solute-binding protein